MRKPAFVAVLLLVGMAFVASRESETTAITPQKVIPDDPLIALGGKVPDIKADAVKSPDRGPGVEIEEVTAASFTPDTEAEDIANVPPAPRLLFVTGSTVNVRESASAKSSRLGQLTRGTPVRVLDETDGWIRILASDGSGLSGWMSSDFLGDTAPAALAPAPEPAPRTREIAAPALADVRKATQAIIDQSIASYQGSCPCPYNRDRAGRRCGERSAWSRRGGYAPVCYESDVSAALLDSYFARLRGAVD